MGFRFHKRIKICKGLYLNLSKKGISTSARIGNVTFNSKGGVSASIPGTGLSYRTNLKGNSKGNVQPTKPKNKNVYCVLTILLGVFGIHHFYLGDWVKGCLYFMTGGLFFFGYIYDLVGAIKLLLKKTDAN